MTEQEIRAYALMIAEIKNQGKFSNIKNCEGSILELNPRQLTYLEDGLMLHRWNIDFIPCC